MSNFKLTDLNSISTLSAEDLLYIVQNEESSSITIESLIGNLPSNINTSGEYLSGSNTLAAELGSFFADKDYIQYEELLFNTNNNVFDLTNYSNYTVALSSGGTRINVPISDDLPAGFSVKFIQSGSQQIVLSAGPGVEIDSLNSSLSSGGPYETMELYRQSNGAGRFLLGKYSGSGGTGGGNMLASIYDPDNIQEDAFDREFHTGTQLVSTISDFDAKVASNTAVATNTAKIPNTSTLGIAGPTTFLRGDNKWAVPTDVSNLTSSGHVGDGTTTTFTLLFTPQTEVPQAFVVGIDGVLQSPIDAYTISTTTGSITFSSAPPVNAEIVVSTANILNGTDISASTIISTGSTTTRLLTDRFADTVNVKDFGAVGDGVTDDTSAIQAFFQYLADNGGNGYLDKGTYKITSGIVLSNPSSGFRLSGTGDESCLQLRSTSSQTALSIVAPSDTIMENFLIDCGHSITGFASHGYSFSDANNVTMRGVNVIDHRNSAGLMFLSASVNTTTDGNLNGDYRNCYIIDSYSDSKGNGQNGFLLESAYSSAIINCHVSALDRSGSPCIGLQLKNTCRYSQIIGGTAEGCLAGVAFGGNNTGEGSAAYYCSIKGVIVKDSEVGALIGKTTSSKVDCIVDMADNDSNTYGVQVTGNNRGLSITASVSNIPTGKPAAKIGSNKTELLLSFPDGLGSGGIAEIDSGVDFTRITVSSIAGFTAQTNVLDYVTDNSGEINNTVHYLPSDATNGLAGLAVQYFHTVGNGATYQSYSKTNNTFTYRMSGSDELALTSNPLTPTSNWLTPVNDNSKSLGRASQRWSTVYAGTASINTSDERHKTFLNIEEAEKAAALEIKQNLRKFKFNDAIEDKADDARIHFGASAQQVGEILSRHNLDPNAYGFYCYDEWDDEFDTEGRLIQEAGNRYGIRYSELLAFILIAL